MTIYGHIDVSYLAAYSKRNVNQFFFNIAIELSIFTISKRLVNWFVASIFLAVLIIVRLQLAICTEETNIYGKNYNLIFLVNSLNTDTQNVQI